MTFTWAITVALNVALPAAMLWRGSWRRFPYLFEAQVLSAALTLMLLIAYYSPLLDRESYENAWILADGAFMLINAVSAWDLMRGDRWATLVGLGFYAEALSRLGTYAADIWNLSSTAYSAAATYFDIALMLAVIIFVYSHGKEISYDRIMRTKEANTRA